MRVRPIKKVTSRTVFDQQRKNANGFRIAGFRMAADAFPLVRVLTLFIGLLPTAVLNAAADDDASPRFERDVQPILVKRCYGCHGWRRRSGLDLRSVELMIKGGEGRSALEPGAAEKSPMLGRVIRGEMPPPGETPPSAEELTTIRNWIDAGAPADHPNLVYGASFFQIWGWLLTTLAVFNMAIAVSFSAKRRSAGAGVILLGLLPLLLTASWFTLPPDLVAWVAGLCMLIGLAIGGGMIAREKGRGYGWGCCLSLLVPIVGLTAVTFASDRSQRSADDPVA